MLLDTSGLKNKYLPQNEEDATEISYTQVIVDNVKPNNVKPTVEITDGYFWSISRHEKSISLMTPIRYMFGSHADRSDWKLKYQTKENRILKTVDINDTDSILRYLPTFFSNTKVSFFLSRSLVSIRDIKLKHIDIKIIKSCSLYATNLCLDTVSAQTLQLYNVGSEGCIIIPFFTTVSRQFLPIGMNMFADYHVIIELVKPIDQIHDTF